MPEAVSKASQTRMSYRGLLALPVALVLLCAACSRAPQTAPAAAQRAADTGNADNAKAQINSVVAVLPLQVSGDDADTQVFADGLANHFTRALAGLPGVATISAESAFRYRNSSELNSVIGDAPVSYTHLDVYKRQRNNWLAPSASPITLLSSLELR